MSSSVPSRASEDGLGFQFEMRSTLTMPWSLAILSMVPVLAFLLLLGLATLLFGAFIGDPSVLPTLLAYAPFALIAVPAAPLIVLLVRATRTNFRLHVEGAHARVVHGGRTIWSGNVGDIELIEGRPWVLQYGDERTELVNPGPELVWLSEQLQKWQTGTADEVPEALAKQRQRAAARTPQ